MAYPGATIYLMSQEGIAEVRYEETEHFNVTRGFLLDHQDYLRRLLGDGPSSEDSGRSSP